MCGWEAGKRRPRGLCVLGSEPGRVGLPGSELPLEQQPLSVLSQWRLQVVSKAQAKEVGREPHTSSLLPDRPRGSHRRQPPGPSWRAAPTGSQRAALGGSQGQWPAPSQASCLLPWGGDRQDPSEPGSRPPTTTPDMLPPCLTPTGADCEKQTDTQSSGSGRNGWSRLLTESGEQTVGTGLHTPGPLIPHAGRATTEA